LQSDSRVALVSAVVTIEPGASSRSGLIPRAARRIAWGIWLVVA
jgi:hypothetical protein